MPSGSAGRTQVTCTGQQNDTTVSNCAGRAVLSLYELMLAPAMRGLHFACRVFHNASVQHVNHDCELERSEHRICAPVGLAGGCFRPGEPSHGCLPLPDLACGQAPAAGQGAGAAPDHGLGVLLSRRHAQLRERVCSRKRAPATDQRLGRRWQAHGQATAREEASHPAHCRNNL